MLDKLNGGWGKRSAVVVVGGGVSPPDKLSFHQAGIALPVYFLSAWMNANRKLCHSRYKYYTTFENLVTKMHFLSHVFPRRHFHKYNTDFEVNAVCM